MVDVLEMLHPAVQRLWFERGFSEPTPPQRDAIPLIIRGKNVLIVAPTGTGKTEAAFLPILSRMLEIKEEGVKLLYITPLRTLNRDILSRLEYWSLKLDLRMGIRHGDTAQVERRKQAIMPPDIMVTTPESLQLLLTGKRLREGLRSLRWVIVDEVHEVADSKRGVQLSILMERLKAHVGRKIQIVGLSATVGNPDEVAKLLVGDEDCQIVYTPVAKRIDVSVVWPDPRKGRGLVGKLMVTDDMAARLRAMRQFIEENRTTLIFTNTRPMVEFLGSRFMLWDEEYPIYVHHGSLSQTKRVNIESMLREGRLKGVICTSSMELGIDIGHVDFVIQFNSPREVRRLVQRVGRAGHALGRVSRGVVIVGDSDNALEAMVLVEKLKKEEIEPSEIPTSPYDVLAHEIIGLVMTGLGRVDSIYELVKRASPFREITKEELDELIDFMVEIGLLRKIWERLGVTQRGYKYFYDVLSTIPEVRQYSVINRATKEFIGFLDDHFVAEYCDIGARFIIGGIPWEVISLTEDTVYVEPTEDYESAIPSWVGEEIPVPFDVALRVGEIRGEVAKLVEEGVSLEEIAKIMAGKFEADVETTKRALRSTYEMARSNMAVPTHNRIVIEDADGLTVVHAHFGNRVNRALARFLGYKISRLTGLPVHISEKPYRIVIRSEASTEEILGLFNVSEEEFLKDLKAAVEESRIFRWRLEQVARRMGVIEKEVRLTKGIVERLIIGLKGTPPYREALKEVMEKDLDVKNALRVIRAVNNGEITVEACKGPSPLTIEHVRSLRGFLEPVNPEKRQIISFLNFKLKILNEFVTFGCLECNHVFSLPIRELRIPKCPICGSSNLAFDLIDEDEMSSRLRRCSGIKGKGCLNLRLSVKLLSKYGLNAIISRAAGLRFREVKGFLEGWKGKDILKELYMYTKRRMQR